MQSSDWCSLCCLFVFFKQKTAYEVRISDWSSDVCSSDLEAVLRLRDDIGAGDLAPGDAQREAGSFRCWRGGGFGAELWGVGIDRKSVVQGKSVSVRVDLGARSIIKKKS